MLRSDIVANEVVDAETTTVVIDAREVVRAAEIDAETVLLPDADGEEDVVVPLETTDGEKGLPPLDEVEGAGDVVEVRDGLMFVTFEVVGEGDEDRVLEGIPVVLLQSELDGPGTTKGEIVAVPVFVKDVKLELALNEEPEESELVGTPPRVVVLLVGLEP